MLSSKDFCSFMQPPPEVVRCCYYRTFVLFSQGKISGIRRTAQLIGLCKRIVNIVATFQNVLAETAGFEFPIGELQDGAIAKTDLLQINHLLVSGATGSGKSVFVDSVLLTLMFHNTPDKIRLILCDTKSTEFLQYNSAEHLLVPVCTTQDKISGVLQWVKSESNKRLQLFSAVGAKNIFSYNDRSWEEFRDEMPHIVVIIDDLSTVINSSPEASELIKHILSVGRTVGVHLIAVTQTPAAKHTKEISLLFFSKAIFQTASLTDYRLLTGKRTASPLNNAGDVLFCNGTSQLQGHTIIPGANDTNNILDSVYSTATKYDECVMHEVEKNTEEDGRADGGMGGSGPGGGEDYDKLLPAAIDVVLEVGQASVSTLQRRLKLGYGRAARLVDQMEEKGVVGPFEGSKPRVILITKEQWQEMQYRQGRVSTAPDEVHKQIEREIEQEALAGISGRLSGSIDEVAPIEPDSFHESKGMDLLAPMAVLTDEDNCRTSQHTELNYLPHAPNSSVSNPPAVNRKRFGRILLSVIIFVAMLWVCLVVASVTFPEIDGQIQLTGGGALFVLGVPIVTAIFLPKAIIKPKNSHRHPPLGPGQAGGDDEEIKSAAPGVGAPRTA